RETFYKTSLTLYNIFKTRRVILLQCCAEELI
ncbi:unnamed protein product, partial [marine sediment metagenome]